MPRFYQNKVSGIVIDDNTTGTDHAWSPDRIIQEIESKLNLSSLYDVSINPTIENGFVLTYNSVSNKWEAKKIISKLSEMSDVDMTNIKDKSILSYSLAEEKFIASDSVSLEWEEFNL
ncbi:hypothetical protein PBI_PBS1_89 [Bacillus phage PBS1]|uniref:Uncharacterized protein n=1 Tax=Bacillus phage PBS1 TaxID=2884423 RepID=A0A223LEG0_BPPB1|nr:hypothetical protein FK780_gp089 [Bacillus phage PBS1]AST99911.1 hypothetical protein PBI_PBS1_89 [Bacillus phage PBS1]BDE75269.1 hypothetical protein [Bacillus phage PBS1]